MVCMRALGNKALLLALGVIMVPFGVTTDTSAGALVVDPRTGVPIMLIGLLIAVSCSSLGEWLLRGTPASPLAWLPSMVFVAACLPMTSWCAFLSVAAYDMPRWSITRQAGNDFMTRVTRHAQHALWPPRLLWLLPVLRMMIENRPDRGMVLTAVVTVVGFVWGVADREITATRRLMRRAQDANRDMTRTSRRRVADLEEERSRSVRMATLNERTRIAREIHDNVGHLLTRAIMQAQAGRVVADATGDDSAAQGFAALAETLDGAMTMVRRSVHDLEDDGTDFSAQVNDAVCAYAESSSSLTVRLANDIDHVPAPVARCLSTVIRESLANVSHHSMAREASVTLRDLPALWQLVVQDPGPAKPDIPTDDTPSHGMGLADIEARVRSVGGISSCGPYQDGWRVFVSVPKSRWSEHVHGASNSSGNTSENISQNISGKGGRA